jgi:hypothetical protein
MPWWPLVRVCACSLVSALLVLLSILGIFTAGLSVTNTNFTARLSSFLALPAPNYFLRTAYRRAAEHLPSDRARVGVPDTFHHCFVEFQRICYAALPVEPHFLPGYLMCVFEDEIAGLYVSVRMRGALHVLRHLSVCVCALVQRAWCILNRDQMILKHAVLAAKYFLSKAGTILASAQKKINKVWWIAVMCMRALKGLALQRASHSGEIALPGSRRLRSTLAAAPVLFACAVALMEHAVMCMRALKGLALQRASHSGEIAVAGSRRLRSTLAAAPVLFSCSVSMIPPGA